MRLALQLLLSALLVVLPGLASGCSQAAPAPQARNPGAAAPAPNAPAQPSGPATAPQEGSAAQGTAERMVVRNASLNLVVADVDGLLGKVATLAQEMGGYLVSSDIRSQDGDRVGKASLRVPSPSLTDAVNRIKAMATRVDRETITSTDVTDEYTDQDARLRTLRATEDQYLQLMKTAGTTEDVIKIQQSLQQVREQIEKTEGRLLTLKRTTEMAVVNLEVSTAGAAKPITSSAWIPEDVLNAALHGLVGVLVLLASLAIWVAVFAPLWVPGLLLFRWLHRRGQRAASEAAHAAEGGAPYPPGAPPAPAAG